MEIRAASLEAIALRPRNWDGFPGEVESIRRTPSSIFPGRVSALVMAMSISLQHPRSIDEPRFWCASISSGSLTGNQFTFKFSLNIEGTPTDVSMSGTIDGDSIKGNGSAGDAGFDFTGARATSASPAE